MTRMLHRIGVTALALAAVVTLAAWGPETGPPAAVPPAPAHASGAGTAAAADDLIDPNAFRQDMRTLWEDHVAWTRLYIVSAVAGLPDLEAAAGRLLQNQDDIGAAVATFYGDDAGAALSDLLRQHILTAADLLAAAKAGDTDEVTAQSDRWYANGDEIARFLADANPAWPFETLSEMMRTHLDQTLTEATARLNGDWEADIAAYDEIHLHILAMADALSSGIIEQFPDRFSS